MIEKLHKDGFNSQQIANELGVRKEICWFIFNWIFI